MRSPRFHTDAYQETAEAKIEAKFESFILKTLKAIKIWKR